MKLFALVLLAALPFFSRASIPPSRMILEHISDNAGSGSYTIEQEVQIPNGAEALSLRETWVIENDHSMKVTVSGPREMKDNLRLQIVYAGGQKWVLKDGRKESSAIPTDFAERFFHWRSAEAALQQLTSLKILEPSKPQKKVALKKGEEFKYEPEDGVRLARTSGVITWAFGIPSTPGSTDRAPGLWVEQDQFLIRKVRWPSQAEMMADQYSAYARGLQLPKSRTIQWGSHTATVRILSVSGRGSAISTNGIDVPWKIQGLEGQPAREAVEEFYKRFR